jgi:hypothetical protein
MKVGDIYRRVGSTEPFEHEMVVGDIAVIASIGDQMAVITVPRTGVTRKWPTASFHGPLLWKKVKEQA